MTGNGANLYYPTTTISVHDANTCAMLAAGESVTRTLFGTKIVNQRNTLWEPIRSQIWSWMMILLREEGAVR